jgi:putative NADH-flavin reductase
MELFVPFSFIPTWKYILSINREADISERTGGYVEHDDHIPLSGSGDLMKDKLLGISIADFAIAIVDEAESEKHAFKHWTVTASLEDDTPTPSYVTLG